ncbi:MAG: RnfABCDGE type electron transport complex subunit B [Firmicutes bacterium]|nr:RnfABCDGE type electron transport complex subunit B [Bacillota bacterium]MCR4712701.1 RnfABCDGE type electron transport complex subunit B [Clostridia bacterium]
MAIPIILVVAVGLVCAVMLSIASKVFFVPVDETAAALREVLPGANCGGCGFAGCDDYANTLAADHDTPCNKCPVGGAAVAAKLAAILGVEAGSSEKQVAVVQCNGANEVTKTLLQYEGLTSCKAAASLYGGLKLCQFGCLGLGDCVAACNYDAIRVVNGVAKVDRNACVACGACAKACPKHLIRIAPEKNQVICFCSNTDKGANTRKACEVGCIGCMKCEKTCKFDAVHVENNKAFIDPEKCKNCGMCAKACPTGAIINLRVLTKAKADAAKKAAEAAAPEAKPAA